MEENILNNIDMTQGVTPEGTPVDNKPMSDLTDIVKTRFADGEPPLDILVDLIMQGVNPDQMGMAFEEIGFDPAAYTQLLQDAEIKLQGIQQQAQAQQQMQQQQMPEQSAQALPPVSEEELLAESERAAREIESQDQPQPMQYGGSNNGMYRGYYGSRPSNRASGPLEYFSDIPRPNYMPPVPAQPNVLGAAYMLSDMIGNIAPEFTDVNTQRNRYKLLQDKNKDYQIKFDPRDENEYVANKSDLARGILLTKEDYINRAKDLTSVNINENTGQYEGFIAGNPYEIMALNKKEREAYDKSFEGGISLNQFIENAQNNPETAKSLRAYFDNYKDMPEGTTIGIDDKGYEAYYDDMKSNPYYRNTMLLQNQLKSEKPSDIKTTEDPQMRRSVMQVPEQEALSFKDWALQDPVTRMGANAQLLYNDYLNNFGSSFKYGGSALPKAQYGRKDFESDEEWAEYMRNYKPWQEMTMPRLDAPFRVVGNIINGLGGGDWDYWDDYDRTLEKETANLGALLTSPKNWVWTDDDGYEPLPNYNEYANKDEAFAAARDNLGRGKSFLYDGIRYTTNYKDEAPNDETEEILKRATNVFSDDAARERFREVWQYAGQPPLTLGLDDEKYSIPAFDAGWLDLASRSDRRRPHVNLINRDNKVYLGRENMTDEQIQEKILDELAHNIQIRRDGTFESLYRFGKGGLREWMNPEYEPYDDTSAFEGEAHEVIAPKLIDYVNNGGKFPEFKYGSELPKAQMMGEFDPNNPFGLPDFSQMGQTSYINPDTGMPYDAPLAANQGNPIMLDETTITAPAMEGLQSKALTEIPIEMPEMNLAPITIPQQSTVDGLVSKGLTEIPIEMPEMKLAPIDLEQYKSPPIADPEIKRKRSIDNALKQAETFVKENPLMRQYGAVSEGLVYGANFLNEFIKRNEFMDYKNDLRNSTMADKTMLTTQNPVNKRGTFDVNTGLAEPDNLVDYYAPAMYGKEMYKKGGEFEPHIMYDPKTGKGYEARVLADHERMAEMGYLHKDEMSYGGEVEVDNDTLAALIAAGADIEML
jgi:hypothetical protein